MVLVDDAVRPAICFYDGVLAMTTPSDVFAETGMAAFDHAVEVLSSSETGSNPLYQATAERALQLLREHLPIAYREDDQEAVQYSLLGAAMSGLGATNVCINHGINHALCARHPVSHGEGNGILLPHGIRFNFEAVPDRIRQIGRALGLQTDSIANDAILEAVVQEVHAIQDELDMPDRLRDVGVEKDDFEGIAKVAITDPAMANNPRQVNESDIVNILEAAW